MAEQPTGVGPAVRAEGSPTPIGRLKDPTADGERGDPWALAAGRGPEDDGPLTVAGVAWRRAGAGASLVVIGRGFCDGHMRSAFATLTIHHGDQPFKATAPVTVPAGGGRAGAARQTLRFAFRLPSTAPTWAAQRMSIRWQGAEIDLPVPDGGSAPPAEEPEVPVQNPRNGHVDRSTESVRRNGREWRAAVIGELELVAQELASCHRELEDITQTLLTREGQARSAESPPPATEDLSDGDPEPAPPSESELEEALFELRRKLERALPATEEPDQPSAVVRPANGHPAVEPAEADTAAFEEPPAPPPSAIAEPADQPAVRTSEAKHGAGISTPAALPGRVERPVGEEVWFPRALRRLAHEDREAAGRVLLCMLPAQAVATPRLVRYDLIVPGDRIYGVDARPLDARVEILSHPRSPLATDAWITATAAQLGQLIVAGRSRVMRRLRRPRVGVKGDRARLGDLLDLAGAPVGLRDLCAVGAVIPPDLLLRMVAGSCRPVPSEGSGFSIRFVSRNGDGDGCAVLFMRDGARFLEDGAGVAEPTTLVRGSWEAFMRLLAELPEVEYDEPVVEGSLEPLRQLQACVKGLEFGSH